MAETRNVIRSQVVPALIAHLAWRGVDVEPVLRRFELPASFEKLRDIEVPLSVVHELGPACAELADDPWFGLHTAEWLPRGSYGLVEFIVRSARDIREAALRLVRHHALLNELALMTFEEGRHEGVVVHRIPGEPDAAGRHGNELVLAMMLRGLRESLGRPGWAPARVAFAHAAPQDASPLVAYFGVSDIAFGRGQNEFAITLDDLALPLASADAALLAVLDEQAMRLVASPASGDAFWSRLREHIRVSLRDGAPRLEAAAAAVGTTPRTLQRRLEEDKTTFQALVDDIRCDLACMYLDGGELAPLDVAFLLGYAERRAFLRAFKRWTGKTPSEYRSERRDAQRSG